MIAVVGASGFVGRHVSAAARDAGLNVRAVAAPRLPHGLAQLSDAEFRAQMDQTDFRRLVSGFTGASAVINCGGLARPTGSDRAELFAANAAMPRMVAMASNVAGVPRLVHVSSAAVQGDARELNSEPWAGPSPALSSYALSKGEGEVAVRRVKPDAVVYRPAGVHANERATTRQLIRLARSPLSFVATPTGNAPQALAPNVGAAIVFLATTHLPPPPIVNHPSEELTVDALLHHLSGRRPRRLPRSAARIAVAALRLAGRFAAPAKALERRLAVLWFGQDQARSWLTEIGWQGPADVARWSSVSAPQRPLVAHVFSVLGRGGAEMRTLEILGTVPKTAADFLVITTGKQKGNLESEFRELGVTVEHCPLGPSFPLAFVRLLRRHRPTVVHSHLASFSGVILLLARVAGQKRRVAHFRSDGDAYSASRSLTRRSWRLTKKILVDRCATDIVGVSPSALEHGWRPGWEKDERARVIPNGISPSSRSIEERAPLRADLHLDGPTVVHVGRLTPEKNRPLAVAVFARFAQRATTATLLIVGPISDQERAQIEGDASDRGLDIRILGERPDVRRLLSAADCCLVTSTREGLPGVVLESLVEGTPVVASPLPGAQFIRNFIPRGIRTVAWDDPHDLWATALMEQVEGFSASDERVALQRDFSSTPFTLDQSVGMFRDLWSI